MNEAEGKSDLDSMTPQLTKFEDPAFWGAATAIELNIPLTGDILLHALKRGLFPWSDPGEPRLWWSPDPRAILYLNDFHVSRSLAKHIRQRRCEITFDCDFKGTVRGCSDRPQTWLDPELINALWELHKCGIAHSVECWRNGKIVGGVYGMDVDGIFIGDSMFSRVDNASKIALAYLVEHLRRCGFTFMDCQVLNEHTETLGAMNVDRTFFYSMTRAIRQSAEMPRWQQEA